MKLTIDRKEWSRGDNDSALLKVSDGKRCCLGFLAKECGYSDSDMLGTCTPASLVYGRGKDNLFPGGLVKELRDSHVTNALMRINDRSDLKDEEDREMRLAVLFKEIGIEVEFVG